MNSHCFILLRNRIDDRRPFVIKNTTTVSAAKFNGFGRELLGSLFGSLLMVAGFWLAHMVDVCRSCMFTICFKLFHSDRDSWFLSLFLVSEPVDSTWASQSDWQPAGFLGFRHCRFSLRLWCAGDLQLLLPAALCNRRRFWKQKHADISWWVQAADALGCISQDALWSESSRCAVWKCLNLFIENSLSDPDQ